MTRDEILELDVSEGSKMTFGDLLEDNGLVATPTAPTDAQIEAMARALCNSKQYNGSNGTCAAICMGKLGDARSGSGCPHAKNVFGSTCRAAHAALIDEVTG